MARARLLRLSSWASTIILFAGMLAAAGGALAASAATQATLYAAPSGSGTACSLAAPCALTEARAVVETLSSGMTGNITVYLMGGTYQLTSTFKLGAQDSGENGHDVDYEAYPGQVPVLSGATKVTGWSLYDSSLHIYRASVPAGTDSSQLFVNGVRAVRARSAASPAGFTLTGSSFVTSDSSYLSYTNASDIVIVDDNDWKEMRCPLSSITKTSSGGSSLNVNPACFAGNNTSIPNVGFPFNGSGLPKFDAISWIENAYQLLTSPGQFYLDTMASYLYYIPLSGQSMATADVELPTQQELVDVSGTPGHLTPINDTAGITLGGQTVQSDGDLSAPAETPISVHGATADIYTCNGSSSEIWN
jgi:hypothetical protein